MDVSLFMKWKDVLAEVTGLIGSEDLKLDLAQSRRKSCPPFE
jgi:hypothetical protein